MIIRSLIILSLFDLGALVFMLAVFFGHAFWDLQRSRLTRLQYERLRREATALFGSGESMDREQFEKHARLNRSVLAEIAASVSGDARVSVTDTARKVGLLSEAARRCQSRRWWVRLRGVREFALYGDGEEVVPARLDDPKSYVRAASIAWCQDHPSEPIIERVVSMLDDADQRCRNIAEDTLNRFGDRVTAPLERYLARASSASRARALRVATRLADPRFLDASLDSATDPDPTVRARSATLLASITGTRAEQVLVGLLDDESEMVRVAAVRGLGRSQSWKFAPKIARLLRDQSWEVRSGAAIALHQIGPGGRLYLRRSLQDHDVFASDIARQVLDIPNE